MRRSIALFAVLLLSSPLLGQENKPPRQEPKKPTLIESKGQRPSEPVMKIEGGPSFKYLIHHQADYLREHLDLSKKQQAKYDKIVEDLNKVWLTPHNNSERVKALMPLRQELAKAEQEKNKAKIIEVSQKIRETRKKYRKPSQLDQLLIAIDPILTPAQREKLPKVLKEIPGNDARENRRVDPRFLLRAVKKMDLDSEQRPKLNKVEKAYQFELKSIASMNRRERWDVSEDIENEVREFLNDKQKAEFDEILKRRLARMERFDRTGRTTRSTLRKLREQRDEAKQDGVTKDETAEKQDGGGKKEGEGGEKEGDGGRP
jgi:hypothetical protein